MKGVVKTLVSDRGFGFIGVEGLEKDVFFLASKMQPGHIFEDLKRGDRVEFEMYENEKGYNAKDTKKV